MGGGEAHADTKSINNTTKDFEAKGIDINNPLKLAG
tara:strand:- start:1920 stop:2027 length:108 start_codon:yes stop_codon:yes gene_type:complete